MINAIFSTCTALLSSESANSLRSTNSSRDPCQHFDILPVTYYYVIRAFEHDFTSYNFRYPGTYVVVTLVLFSPSHHRSDNNSLQRPDIEIVVYRTPSVTAIASGIITRLSGVKFSVLRALKAKNRRLRKIFSKTSYNYCVFSTKKRVVAVLEGSHSGFNVSTAMFSLFYRYSFVSVFLSPPYQVRVRITRKETLPKFNRME